MRTTIDRGGRVVVPKPLRDRLGLDAGQEVEVELAGDAVVIRAVPAGTELDEVDGVLVARRSSGAEPVEWSPEQERELLEAVRHHRR